VAFTENILLIGGGINMTNMIMHGPRWVSITSGVVMYMFMLARAFKLI